MEGWFQPTKPRRKEAHVAALFTGPTSFAAAICTLQGYSECTHILASRQKISCSWKRLCGEAIYFSCVFLAKAGLWWLLLCYHCQGELQAGERTKPGQQKTYLH